MSLVVPAPRVGTVVRRLSLGGDKRTAVPIDPTMDLNGDDLWKLTKEGEKRKRAEIDKEARRNIQPFEELLASTKQRRGAPKDDENDDAPRAS